MAHSQQARSMAAPPAALLLVEDHPVLCDMLAELLRDAGYHVVTAKSAAQAVAQLESDAAGFDAVLSDIRLGGGGSGWDVVGLAHRHDARVGMIYLSADSGHEWAQRGLPGSLFLQKPFSGNQLLQAVARVLGAAGGQVSRPAQPGR